MLWTKIEDLSAKEAAFWLWKARNRKCSYEEALHEVLTNIETLEEIRERFGDEIPIS